MNTFEELSSQENIRRALRDMQFTTPTEIQAKAIPLICAGKDLLGKSHTGTGKTLAFGIPAVESIKDRGTQVLVISPTRELVMQTGEEFHKLLRYTENIRTAAVYGGQPIQYQIPQLRRGAEIVIGTPGRLIDHIQRKTLNLSAVKMVVLDEADEMLDMGFREDMETILNTLLENHQTLLFSATMSPEIQEIAQRYLKEPQIIEAGNQQEKTIDTIAQYFYQVSRGHKPEALSILLHVHHPQSCIVFCNTKKRVDELCRYLNEHHFNASGLHGDMKQETRTAVMRSFKNGQTSILIATDVAARGIDVNHVSAVYNFDLPQDFEYYVHRIGRTGRAGKKGVSYTLVCGKREYSDIQELQKYTGVSIEQKPLPSSNEVIQDKQEEILQQILEKAEKTQADSRLVERMLQSGIDSKKLACILMQMLMEREMKQIPDMPLSDANPRLSDVKEGYIRLRFSLGRKQRVAPNHILAAIAQATRIPGDKVEKIHCFQEYSLVEIPSKFRNLVLSKVDGSKINGQKVNVRIYDEKQTDESAAPKKEKSSKRFSGKEKRKVYAGRRGSEKKQTRKKR